MKKSILFILTVIMSTFLYSCTKESIDHTEQNDTIVDNADTLSSLVFAWDMNLPHTDDPGAINMSIWIDDATHTFQRYDSIRHWMDLNFIGDYTIEIQEGFTAKYSKAFRFTGDRDTLDSLIFNPYTDDWIVFDTTYIITKTVTKTAVYNGEYPDITFDVIGASTVNNSGVKPNYDYRWTPWTASPKPYIHFCGKDSLMCYILTNWESSIDTICRQFVSVQ